MHTYHGLSTTKMKKMIQSSTPLSSKRVQNFCACPESRFKQMPEPALPLGTPIGMYVDRQSTLLPRVLSSQNLAGLCWD